MRAAGLVTPVLGKPPATIAGVSRRKLWKGEPDIVAHGTTGHIGIEHTLDKELDGGDGGADDGIKRPAADEGGNGVGDRTLKQGFEFRLQVDCEQLKDVIRQLVHAVHHRWNFPSWVSRVPAPSGERPASYP